MIMTCLGSRAKVPTGPSSRRATGIRAAPSDQLVPPIAPSGRAGRPARRAASPRGRWHDYSVGATTFREYVEKTRLPSKHIELTTRAAYHSNLDKHFLPFFGNRSMARILPWNVQEWVTMATAHGPLPDRCGSITSCCTRSSSERCEIS